jgi:hypothetical protein
MPVAAANVVPCQDQQENLLVALGNREACRTGEQILVPLDPQASALVDDLSPELLAFLASIGGRVDTG